MKLLFSSLMILFVTTVAAATEPRIAYNLVQEGKAVMVDVREKEEIAEGMVDIAVWFPKSKTDTDSNWIKDFIELAEGKEIFLYCRSGRRSEAFRKLLKAKGIESVNIGGYDDLKNILPTSIPKKSRKL